ncbi:MAG: PQQ-dependent sugar dehydrogenase [Planctomycetota bacterium]
MIDPSTAQRGQRARAARITLGSVLAVALSGCERDVEPMPRPAPLTWTDTAPRLPDLPPKLWLREGLTLRTVAAEPWIENPVAFDVDDRGRVFVVETHRYLRSVFDITQQPAWLRADLSLRTVADRAAFLAEQFRSEPQLLEADSERVRLLIDLDGDGTLDRATTILDGFRDPTAGTAAGVLAHGDDLWFTCIPDLVHARLDAGLRNEPTREVVATGFGVHIGVSGHDLHGLTLGPDGRIWFSVGDRGASLTTREGNRIDIPDTGAVFRCEPDGSKLELFATGLRNPQELAFDDHGNLFAGDNDTAGADASRVLYVVENGDYGWRCAYQHMDGFGPWVAESVWKGGIDGLLPGAGFAAQGPSGMAFHPGTGLTELAGRMLLCDFPGGIVSFRLDPLGAGFEVENVERVVWSLWPSDLCFGPDGDLWVLDWVSGWAQPNKGRIHRVTAKADATDPLVAETRRLLADGMHARSNDELAGLLGHGNRRVRMRAQLELVARGARGVESLSNVLTSAQVPLARLHALWGLGIAGRRGADVADAIGLALNDRDTALREHAARLAGELSVHELAQQLGGKMTDGFAREKFFAAIALGKLRATAESSRVLAMIEANADGDPFLVHAGVEAIGALHTPEELAAMHADPVSAVRRVAMLALRRRASPEIAVFLADGDQRIRSEAARAIYDVPIEPALAALADRVESMDLTPSMRGRAIGAARRLGRSEDVLALARLAGEPLAEIEARIAALDALGSFAAPDAVDPILGDWRPIAPRDASIAREAVERFASSIPSASDPRLLSAFVRAVRTLAIPSSGAILAKFARDSGDPGVRVEALRGLVEAGEIEAVTAAIEQLIASSDPELVLAAIRAVRDATAPTIDGRLASLAGDAATPLTLRQAAIAALPRGGRECAATLAFLTSNLAALEPSVRLDVRVAAGLPAPDDAKDPLAAWRDCLDGGDAVRGRAIFEQRQDVSCIRCHAVAGVGGTVGPALDKIGARRDAESILRSLVQPMAEIVDGYPAAMPDVARHALTPIELRDLVAWLRSLR